MDITQNVLARIADVIARIAAITDRMTINPARLAGGLVILSIVILWFMAIHYNNWLANFITPLALICFAVQNRYRKNN